MVAGSAKDRAGWRKRRCLEYAYREVGGACQDKKVALCIRMREMHKTSQFITGEVRGEPIC